MLILILIGLSIVYYTDNQRMVHVPPCNATKTHLSNIINNSFDKNELPSDLQPFIRDLSKSNTTVFLQNCSDISTLKQYLFERAANLKKGDISKLYYTALYAYLEIKFQIQHYMIYIPKTNADIILLTNSFASATLNPLLERKLHLFFFYYGNWLEKLVEMKFPFNIYHNPRSLLLDMICELINNPSYRVYEREVIFFLTLNHHTCDFIENYHRHTNNIEHPLKETSLGHNYSNNTIKNLNSSNDIILFQNVSFRQTGNQSNLFLSFSIVKSIKQTPMNVSEDLERQTHNITTEFPTLTLNTNPSIKDILTNTPQNQTTQNILSFNQTEIPSAILPSAMDVSASPYLLDKLQQKPLNLSKINATHSDINQKYQQIENQHILNFTVWDIVEMDGPCKEGQEHVVKLNVQSILTAIDEHVSNSSIELFRKLLNNVKAFPIEDYNARGELLRDLLLALWKEQNDPLIKKSIEDILDHLILDGPGALPPKIKLECVNAPEGNFKRATRRTRRVFDLQFD